MHNQYNQKAEICASTSSVPHTHGFSVDISFIRFENTFLPNVKMF